MPIHFSATAIKEIILAAVEAEANASILPVSNDRIPVADGVAKRSGRVVRDAERIVATYGRDDDGTGDHAPSNTYIERLHEDAELRHPHGGQAFFLRTAADEAADGFAERVARRVGL